MLTKNVKMKLILIKQHQEWHYSSFSKIIDTDCMSFKKLLEAVKSYSTTELELTCLVTKFKSLSETLLF